ncbi:MAG: hypothetical protein R3B84_06325 [Zavarzinella sp.]
MSFLSLNTRNCTVYVSDGVGVISILQKKFEKVYPVASYFSANTYADFLLGLSLDSEKNCFRIIRRGNIYTVEKVSHVEVGLISVVAVQVSQVVEEVFIRCETCSTFLSGKDANQSNNLLKGGIQ